MEWALPLIAATILAFAAVSRRRDGTSITAPMVFTGVGVVAGAKAAGLVDPSPTGESVKVLAEATLAVVLSPMRRGSTCARSARGTVCRRGSSASACR
jgi:hypothetical protein